MARDLSVRAKEVLATRTARTHIFVTLTFAQEVGETTPLVLHYATGQIYDPNISVEWYAGIRDCPEMRESLGGAIDKVDLKFENESLLLAGVIGSLTRTLDGCKAFLEWGIYVDETWEYYEIIRGQLTDVAMTENIVSATLYSEFGLPYVVMGADPVIEACDNEFNKGNCNYATGSTLPVIQRVHTECNKIFGSVNGCSGRGMQHRHSGCPTLDVVAAIQSGVGDIGGTGGGSPGVDPSGYPSGGGVFGDGGILYDPIRGGNYFNPDF